MWEWAIQECENQLGLYPSYKEPVSRGSHIQRMSGLQSEFKAGLNNLERPYLKLKSYKRAEDLVYQ